MAIEVNGLRASTGGAIGLGLLLAGVGVLLLREPGATIPCAILIGLGLLLAILSARRVIWRVPQVRATDAGASFSGGAVIAWTDIKRVYAGGVDVSFRGLAGRTQSIAFDFHRTRTRFRLPIDCWFAGLLSIGDIDVSSRGARADVLASQLEAMRVRATGHVDGVTTGTTELPQARVVERDP